MDNNETMNIETIETEATELESTTEKTYTAEQLQAEVDRRVTQALKTQQKKFDKQLSLANLDETARKDAEQRSRIEELEEQLRDFATEKNRSEIKSVLANRGLPVGFANLIHIGDDIEEAQRSVDEFDKAFKSAVAVEVKKRLASSSPETGTPGEPASLKGMSLSEQQRLFQSNPELYKKLSQH